MKNQQQQSESKTNNVNGKPPARRPVPSRVRKVIATGAFDSATDIESVIAYQCAGLLIGEVTTDEVRATASAGRAIVQVAKHKADVDLFYTDKRAEEDIEDDDDSTDDISCEIDKLRVRLAELEAARRYEQKHSASTRPQKG